MQTHLLQLLLAATCAAAAAVAAAVAVVVQHLGGCSLPAFGYSSAGTRPLLSGQLHTAAVAARYVVSALITAANGAIYG